MPWRACLAVALVGLVAGVPASARAGSGFLTGFADPAAFQQASVGDRTAALAHAREARATLIRLLIHWDEVSPQSPPTLDVLRDPSWAGYDWARVDAMVRAVADAGLQPVLSFSTAPRWAEGPHRPPVRASAPAGTWKPSPAAYGAFAEAAARRYSGVFPDPLRLGVALPRVRDWQAWSEANLSVSLSPQWRRRGGRFQAVSPADYRGLLNAFYDAVKSVDQSNLVISAGTAPYGDPPGGQRMAPAAFTRSFLCVRGRRHPRALRCPGGPAKFDVLAHHPYPFGAPGRHAISPDDVVVPDFSRLTRPLAVALRAGNVYPRRHKRVWATEMSYDSSPPDPGALPLGTQARWLSGAFYLLWRQGVDAVLWWQIRDSPRGRGYRFSLQSGVFFRGRSVAQDRPKPSYRAFRFPFAAYRSGGSARPWGVAPVPGPVQIQRLTARGWRTIKVLRSGADRVFAGRVRVALGARLRAVRGTEASLSWRVF